MFLLVTCQHASGTCQSHFRTVLSLREAPRKYIELFPNPPPFLTLQFHEKDLTLTPNLLRIQPIPPLLGHILSPQKVDSNGRFQFDKNPQYDGPDRITGIMLMSALGNVKQAIGNLII
jgi:hypothetical protein